MGAVLPTVENACVLMVHNTIVSSSLSIPLTNVYTGLANDTKALPEVICYAEDAKQRYKDIDWWDVKTNILVIYRAASSERALATSEANTIFDAFYDVSASVALNGLTSSFTCAEILDKSYSNTFEQDCWVQCATFTMLACPSS